MHIDKNEDSLKKLLPYDSKYVTFWKRQYYGDGKKITGCQRFEGNEGMNRWNTGHFNGGENILHDNDRYT